MEQVPIKNKPYLIVGNGRMASHLVNYFSMLNIDFHQWRRKDNLPIEPYIKFSNKILLAISDDSIDSVSRTIPNKLKIHFSGVLSIKSAESAHPLFTFGLSLNNINDYEEISFITEKGRKGFKELFPELKNSYYEISKYEKPIYHAWASMVGNFSSILISEYSKVLKKLSLPISIADPYLKQVIKNSLYDINALTGPIIRGDTKTIEKHLISIDKDFEPIYRSFVKLIEKRKKYETDSRNN